jgi:hypothetical protein
MVNASRKADAHIAAGVARSAEVQSSTFEALMSSVKQAASF